MEDAGRGVAVIHEAVGHEKATCRHRHECRVAAAGACASL